MGTKEIMSMLPADLKNELEARVKSGEFKSIDDLIEAALRYYFERHSSKDLAGYVDEEIHTAINGSA
jgi:Arc/MetJ-type ribon-helix-helix transcriptional regulator